MLRSPVVSRLANRQIRADGARSALIIALIALPIAFAVAAMTLVQSSFASRDQEVAVTMGSAQTLLSKLEGADGKCLQEQPRSWYCKSALTKQAPITSKLAEVAEPGSVSEGYTTVTQLFDGIKLPSLVITADLSSKLFVGRWQPAELPGSDEVLATPDAMRLFGLQLGDKVHLDGRDYRISGETRRLTGSKTSWIASLPWENTDPRFVVGPGHRLASFQPMVVFLERAISASEREELNRRGIAAFSRQTLLEQPPEKDVTKQTYPATIFLVELAVFVVVGSIVGAAFSVNLRNQQRNLALLSATGATAKVVRGTVLRMGLFLGLVGAALGAIGGLGLGWLLFQLATQQRWLVLFGPNWPVMETVGLAAIGVVVTVLAAWFPARGVLKADVLTSLRSSRAASKAPKRPWLAMVFGIAGSALIGMLWWIGSNYGWTTSSYVTLVLGGFGAGITFYLAGLLAAGWLLHRLSNSDRGPLAWRTALRDADRNRGRTIATVIASASAALLAVMPLMLAWLIQQNDYQEYRPKLPPKMIWVRSAAAGEQSANEVVKSIETVIGSAAGVTKLYNAQANENGGGVELVVQPGPCNSSLFSRKMQPNCQFQSIENTLLIGDVKQLRFLLGGPRPEVEAALEAGSVVAFQPQLVNQTGKVEVTLDRYLPDRTKPKLERAVLPGIKAADLPGMEPMVSKATAAKLGLNLRFAGVLIRSHRELTPADKDALARVVLKLGNTQADAGVYFDLDTGPYSRAGADMLPIALAGAAAILVLAVLGVVLSVRDGQATRLALVNIGAKRSTLRKVVAVQAVFATTVGVLIGVAAGILPTLTIGVSLGFSPLSLPWVPLLLLIAVPIPLVALGAALLVKPEPTRVIREV